MTDSGSSLHIMQAAMRAALHEGQPAAFLEQLDPGAARPAAEQFQVYAGMYWARLAQSLQEDFPTVQRLLGAALFERVAVTHGKRHPSTSPSLAWLGRDFSETLTMLGCEREAEVATMEWAQNEAFWAPDATVIDAPTLGALGEQLGDAVLVLHPSLRLVDLAHGVRAVVEGAAPEVIDGQRREIVAVWRRGNRVVYEELAGANAAALAGALGGETVAALCERFLEAEEPSQAALQALLRWVQAGWVCSARVPPRPNGFAEEGEDGPLRRGISSGALIDRLELS